MSTLDTQTLIANLADDLAPFRRLAHPLKRITPWVIIAALYIAVVVNYLGLRHDLEDRLADPFFLFEIALVLSIGVTAALVSFWLCVPDMRGQGWIAAVPLTLLSVFVAWCLIVFHAKGFEVQPVHWRQCINDAALMGFVPAAFIVFMMLKGRTTKPLLMGAMNILAVGSFGYVGLHFSCPLDDAGHVSVYHILPFVMLGAVFGTLARRIYSW